MRCANWPDASDEQRHAVVEAYKTGFRDLRLSGALREPLYDGIAGLIDELSGEGWQLAVATGKSDRGRTPASTRMASGCFGSPCRPPTGIPRSRILPCSRPRCSKPRSSPAMR